MTNPTAPGPATTLGNMKQAALALLTFPALTALVFLRSGIGVRQLKPLYIALAFIGALAFTTLVNLFGSLTVITFGGFRSRATGISLHVLFCLAFAGYAAWQRREAFNDLLGSQQRHPDSRGESRLEKRFPVRLELMRFQRFVEPALVLFVGFFVSGFARPLGLWLMFAAFCLLVAEAAYFDQQFDWLCNRVAARKDAETVQQEAKDRRMGAAGQRRASSGPPAPPPGLPAELRARIEANRRQLLAVSSSERD